MPTISFQTSARKQAKRLIKQFYSNESNLYKLALELKNIGPYARDEYFRSYLINPEECARYIKTSLILADEPLGECLSLALGLRTDATHATYAELMVAYAATRRWYCAVEKLLARDGIELNESKPRFVGRQPSPESGTEETSVDAPATDASDGPANA